MALASPATPRRRGRRCLRLVVERHHVASGEASALLRHAHRQLLVQVIGDLQLADDLAELVPDDRARRRVGDLLAEPPHRQRRAHRQPDVAAGGDVDLAALADLRHRARPRLGVRLGDDLVDHVVHGHVERALAERLVLGHLAAAHHHRRRLVRRALARLGHPDLARRRVDHAQARRARGTSWCASGSSRRSPTSCCRRRSR